MKGEYGQECNITACQKPNSAYWFNHFNKMYYCEECANRLNNDEFNKRDAQRLLGHQMCTYESRESTAEVVKMKVTETLDKIDKIMSNTLDDSNYLSGKEQRRLRRKFERRTKKK